MRRGRSVSDPHEPVAIDQVASDQRRGSPGEHLRRRSLLHDDPDIGVVSMAELVRIAKAIENEAVSRYTQLAGLMDLRGEPATAVAFRVMAEEERQHVAAVDRWAASVGPPPPVTESTEWRLPSDLASSWDDIAGSTLLTPYRAFAVAVENEERAFSFYAYVAAHGENALVMEEAGKLAAEELRHAALFRRWRRRAYHRERRIARAGGLQIDSVEMLRAVLAQHEAAIAAVHTALAQRLRRAGDEASALLLEQSISTTTRPPDAGAVSSQDTPALQTAPERDAPRHLLIDAQKPLEALADVLEAVMASSDGDLFEEAATAMDAVIKRMARVSLQIRGASQA